jgi:hypothetical protein
MPEALTSALVMLDLVLDARGVPASGTPEACFLARATQAFAALAPGFAAAAHALQADPSPAAWRALKAEAAALKLAMYLRLDREAA